MTDKGPEQATFEPDNVIRNLTQRPGVYRMYDDVGTLLYVGKAKNLRKRVASYFGGRAKDAKTMALVAHVAGVDVTVTHTETEALILEHTLIKAHKPRFNVLLRDDKSYPWIVYNHKHEYPRLAFYRGRRHKRGQFFGPFPNSGAVRETLAELQKLFLIRPCRDSFFRNRSRPCLQYQINRCSGPCVGLISEEDYAADMANAVAFLRGRNHEVIDRLGVQMERASTDQDYERAARLRDQIAKLRRVDAEQVAAGQGLSDLDVFAIATRGATVVLTVLSIRRGTVTGTQSFFPRVPVDTPLSDVYAAFLGQYYLERSIPAEIVVSEPVTDAALIESALSERREAGVRIRHRVRGDRAKWLAMAAANAQEAAALRVTERQSVKDQLAELAEVLNLETVPERIECFDISHTSGQATVASCVVFDHSGAKKTDYRRFNIRAETGGDDYLAMEEALQRRYARLKKEAAKLPDLVLIDGGKGQLGRSIEVMTRLELPFVQLVGVAKGRARRAGSERLFFPGRKGFQTLDPSSGASRLIQNIRDEAHRFAIAGHRAKRAKTVRESPLEGIHGLGPKRRASLLKEFGGMQGIAAAGIEDLMRTHGISREMATKIYNRFHTGAELDKDVRK